MPSVNTFGTDRFSSGRSLAAAPDMASPPPQD
jgi:hypothetical protein